MIPTDPAQYNHPNMPTYFLSLRYKGTRYGGFQIQENAMTVQGEVEKALYTFLRSPVSLTGSSRTDAGVHALRNYFHFCFDGILGKEQVYRLNAILPADIAVEGIYTVPEGSHSRFAAVARSYRYVIYTKKDPFMDDRAWYYPYPMDAQALNACARIVMGTHDFTSFAKKRTQVYTHICTISQCQWERTDHGWVFTIQGNRFLRGMVRALVGTMVKTGRGKMDVDAFQRILLAQDSSEADFSAPAQGLFLEDVIFPQALSALLR